MPTVSEIGERSLIEIFMKHLTPMPDMPIPFWDDASAIDIGNNRAIVVNTDMLVWETDIPKGMTPFQAARKAVVMNISDLAAKGVKPIAFMPSLAIPSDYSVGDAEELLKGFEAGARMYDSYVVGGDTNEAYDVIISGLAMGITESKKIMKRDNGVKPGHKLAVTGDFGLTSAGFKYLLDDTPLPDALNETILNSIYLPEARVNEGIALAETGCVTSCMDSSDGLSVSLYDLMRSSGYGFTLDQIPVHPTAEKFAVYNDLNPNDLALFGGEEYELVFTYSPRNRRKIARALEDVECELITIGTVSESDEIVYAHEGEVVPIKKGGWDHFNA
ncbi:thiamine-phosphate kinase [Candidatus Bathyarchaeota archaeon]|jgi:thiamine-monophosphate kinase|nr:thiamine-phosphate kinase [Candidatus Bathyarchaeota archaeon]MBT4319701.1 thiamine-phosphate kinase [Candidatus Bathyarchaeota archaeon]MBT4424616.1 thiamine-phosphate kinase [Candidatus Bathyarchaeota archaeon]MBT5641558.1 thiamine-phosphate kinase [Candidatus Bathyarchaeota archaeon]MBT6604399.1 thiamine-phosphate kinase [Candidatus Bathyarchaeota archaeon]